MATDVSRLIRDLASAGVPIRDTKSGWLIGCPDGTSVTVHRTESDHRALKNTMARLKRAGIQLDKENEVDSKARKDTLDNVRRVLHSLGNPNTFQVSKVYGELDMAPQTVYRALTQMGYSKLGHGVWGTVNDSTTTEVVEAPTMTAEEEEIENIVKNLENIEVRVIESHTMPWDKPVDVTEPTHYNPFANVHTHSIPVSVEPAEREFIDSVDSFVLDTAQVSDLTIDQLARSLEVAGIKFEIRAWR